MVVLHVGKVDERCDLVLQCVLLLACCDIVQRKVKHLDEFGVRISPNPSHQHSPCHSEEGRKQFDIGDYLNPCGLRLEYHLKERIDRTLEFRTA